MISLAVISLLTGCVMTNPVNYAPSSVLSASGHVSVSDFAYLPALQGKVKPNQIRNTAIGSALFDQNISTLFRDAVFKELRFVGVNIDDQARVLTGEIEEFLIDDIGFKIDWTVRVTYTVSGPGHYKSTKEFKRRTSKFTDPPGVLNETIKLSIEELIKDPEFIAAIK